MQSNKPIFFIYQNGFRQISLPALKENYRNPEMINLTSCDDGVFITTEGDMEEVVRQMREHIGKEVMGIWCDENEIKSEGVLKDVVYQENTYRGNGIYLDVR